MKTSRRVGGLLVAVCLVVISKADTTTLLLSPHDVIRELTRPT